MTEFTDYLENKLLDHTFRNTTYTPAATVYLALFTTNCSDSTRGTEVSTGGYARLSVAFNAASGGSVGNTSVRSFTASGANYGTVICTGIEDALTTGNELCFDTGFTDTAVNDGDTLQFAATTGITISLD
jgi:hypothetical protein